MTAASLAFFRQASSSSASDGNRSFKMRKAAQGFAPRTCNTTLSASVNCKTCSTKSLGLASDPHTEAPRQRGNNTNSPDDHRPGFLRGWLFTRHNNEIARDLGIRRLEDGTAPNATTHTRLAQAWPTSTKDCKKSSTASGKASEPESLLTTPSPPKSKGTVTSCFGSHSSSISSCADVPRKPLAQRKSTNKDEQSAGGHVGTKTITQAPKADKRKSCTKLRDMT